MATYDAGTWFLLLDDSVIRGPGKRRPCVLVAAYSTGRNVRVRVRTASVPFGLPHVAHPTAHEPTCQIDDDGWIQKPHHTLRVDLLHDHYSCVEPNSAVIADLASA